MDTSINGARHYDTPKDDEGRVWWTNPDRIGIVKARRFHQCSCCGKIMGGYKRYTYRRGIKPYYYVGVVDGGCRIPEWGYEIKLCFECALDILGDHRVYRCEYYGEDCDLCGYYPDDHHLDITSEGKLLSEYIELYQSPSHKTEGRQN